MRHNVLAVLMTCAVVGSTVTQRLADMTPQTVEAGTRSQDTTFVQVPTFYTSIVAENLVVAQNMPSLKPLDPPSKKPKDPKDPKDKDSSPPVSSETINIYECIEYCAIVRQSCDGLATIQPNVNTARIGSRENNNLSRDCHNIYTDCTKQCQVDDSQVNWKRGHPKKEKEKEKKSKEK